MTTRLFSGLLIIIAVLGITSCKSDNPTSSNHVPSLQRAAIFIGGVDVANATIRPGMGTATRYLAYPSNLQPGLSVMMQFHIPGAMGQGLQTQMMYDDGTHGDHFAGDGEYCYEDTSGMPGIHMMNAMMGHYSFEFYCQDSQGNHSMHRKVSVDVQ